MMMMVMMIMMNEPRTIVWMKNGFASNIHQHLQVIAAFLFNLLRICDEAELCELTSDGFDLCPHTQVLYINKISSQLDDQCITLCTMCGIVRM